MSVILQVPHRESSTLPEWHTVVDGNSVTSLIAQWADTSDDDPITLSQEVFDNTLSRVRHGQTEGFIRRNPTIT
jgi:hypothetical protein